jgi:nitric oxide reductase NorQ protein
LLDAPPEFQLIVSYNPGYQHILKDLKPSTRQRFVALDLTFPPSALETRIVAHESGVEAGVAGELVSLAGRLRQLRDRGLPEVPSTRLLVLAARLIACGVPAREACRTAMAAPLTDDPELVAAIHDVIDAVL